MPMYFVQVYSLYQKKNILNISIVNSCNNFLKLSIIQIKNACEYNYYSWQKLTREIKTLTFEGLKFYYLWIGKDLYFLKFLLPFLM